MRRLAGLALFALLPACGGSNSGSPSSSDAALAESDAYGSDDSGGLMHGGSDTPSVAAGCDRAAALCTLLDSCAPFYVKAVYGDVVACADRVTKACTAQSAATGSGFTQANLLACEAALKTATCDAVFANNLPCNFNGTLTDGTTCGDNSQCQSGFCQRQRGSDLCGACAPKSGAAGACNSGSSDECQSGLVCNQNKTCVAPATIGTACDDKAQPCLTGLFCTSAQTCAVAVAAGQDCPGAFLDLTHGTLCAGKGTAASPQTSTQLGAAGVGQTCGLAPGNGLPPTLCAPGSVAACTLVSGGITLFGLPTKGLCAAPIQDGFTCSATDICQAGAQCINGFCQIPSGRYCQP
jgi:hypothetical protein